jgi:hypothetical protein
VNEPQFVGHVAAAVAAARGMTTRALVQATNTNFFRLFTKIPSSVAEAVMDSGSGAL